MYIGIKDGKIFDVCSDLKNKRKTNLAGVLLTEEEISQIVYIQSNLRDLYINDTWDSINKCSLRDSPERFIEPEKSDLKKAQDKVIELENRIKTLELKYK